MWRSNVWRGQQRMQCDKRTDDEAFKESDKGNHGIDAGMPAH
jgi:hypothetical protein